ncbi:MAG: phospholipid carrier-dependent glycosyltransferase, partial [Phycisphaerae bacterium]|nr:phospholipid carrier-dependent glycosyltransferase [Phycisphaerae bacterium]
SFPLFMVESKLATADALLTVFMVSALGLWLGMQAGQRRWYWAVLLGLALGLGTLTKGPVIWLFIWAGSMATLLLQMRRGRRWGLWLVAASVVGLAGLWGWGPPKTVQTGAEIGELLGWLGGGLLILSLPVAGAISLGPSEGKGRDWRRLFKSYGLVVLGMVVAAVVFLPWGLAAVIWTNGAYWSEGVGRHVVQRSAESLEGHWGPPGYYLASWIVCAFPWSVLGPVALWQGWRISKRDRRVAGLLGWVIGPWLVLEVVQTKLVHYVLGCYPAMALLIAVVLYQWRHKLGEKMLSRLARMSLSALWIIALVLAIGMILAVGVLALGPIAELGEGATGRYGLVLGAGLAGLVVIATALAVRVSLKKGSGSAAVASGFVGVMICGAIAGGWVAPRIGSYRISRRAAEAAREISPGETRFVLFGFDEPSVIWYLKSNRKVVIVKTVEEFVGDYEKDEPICAIVSKKKMEKLKASGFELAEARSWVEGLYLEWPPRKIELWVGLNKAAEAARNQAE